MRCFARDAKGRGLGAWDVGFEFRGLGFAGWDQSVLATELVGRTKCLLTPCWRSGSYVRDYNSTPSKVPP